MRHGLPKLCCTVPSCPGIKVLVVILNAQQTALGIGELCWEEHLPQLVLGQEGSMHEVNPDRSCDRLPSASIVPGQHRNLHNM